MREASFHSDHKLSLEIQNKKITMPYSVFTIIKTFETLKKYLVDIVNKELI